MKQGQTLFRYLHDALVMQIVSGKLAYGERIPSLRSLCGIYQVGIRTVRDVTDALMKEGYIESVQRSHMQVSYQAGGNAREQAERILAKQDSMCSLFKTLAYIIPHIYAEAAVYCDIQMLKDNRKKSGNSLQRITSVYNNSLLQDLCIDMELFLQVTDIPGFANPYKDLAVNEANILHQLYDSMECRNYQAIYDAINHLYLAGADALDKYFLSLHAAYQDLAPEQAAYSWDAKKGRVRTYMQVTRSLLKNILYGVYKDGTYLPPNAQLCKEYNISAYTVGKVMEELSRIGIIKQVKLRGGYLITCQDAKAKGLLITNSTPRADALTYLSALHLIALMSKGLALLGFDNLDNEKIADLTEKAENMDALKQAPGIIAMMIQCQPFQPLKAIYSQLINLLDWGFYFAFSFNDKPHVPTIRKYNLLMLSYIKAHDKNAFADAVQQNYYYIFGMMRDTLIEMGVTEAQNMRLPTHFLDERPS